MTLNQSQLKFASDFGDAPGTRPSRNRLSAFDILAAFRRQVWVIAGSIIVAVLAGILYLAQAIPSYTSSVSILIDAKKVGMTATNALEGSLTFEAGAVDSQLQILTSDKLASNVAQRLGLQNNLAFLEPDGSLVSNAIAVGVGFVRSTLKFATNSSPAPEIKDLPENVRLLMATAILQNNTRVQRIGRTYVFSLDYTDTDQSLAQAIAGQYANAYLEDQLDSKFESTRRATSWMEERIRELKGRSLAADEAVQKYRAENNLFAVSGRLLDEQSLTDATTQLTTAKAALDTASARYQRLKEIVDNQDITGSLTEVLSNPNVASLRAKYLDASKASTEISAKYGDNHQAAVKARRDMQEYTRLIFEELKNLLPGYRSDVAIAQTQVNSIQDSIEQLRLASTTNDSAMVKLRALEQESDTLKTLYSTFLQKSQELQQQQSFPVTDARIISDASTPLLPSGPKKVLILLASLILGGALGVAIAALREWRDRGFRTATQVRDELGLDFIANVPAVKNRGNSRVSAAGPERFSPQEQELKKPQIDTTDELLQTVINEPFSQFSEAIRAVRSKLFLSFPQQRGLVVGVVSMFPDEGKSTLAKNLASSIALQGTSTVLVDGDFRNPSLTNRLSGASRLGFVDVLNGQAEIAEVLQYENESGLAFLPGATRRRQANDVFGSSRISGFVDQLRKQFEVIVIDFPPAGALTDAVAANNIVDGYFFAVHWGKTQRHVVRDFIDSHEQFADKTLGVVLNRVDMKKLGRYGAYEGSSAYFAYSQKYFSSKS